MSAYEFIGELALTGELRPVKGTLPVALSCTEAKRTLVVPKDNAEEAGLVPSNHSLFAEHLLEVCQSLAHNQPLPECVSNTSHNHNSFSTDMSDVIAQESAKRAMTIAASGKHHLMFIGPPGTGKSMLASRMPTILTPMNDQEAKESASIYSVSHLGFDATTYFSRKYRDPHHSCSAPALIGGGCEFYR